MDRAKVAWPRLERAIDARSAERFVEVVGRRMALLGNERGSFELWMWPLKIGHDLTLAVRTGEGRDRTLAELVRSVEIDPFRLVLRAEHDSLALTLELFAALDERALVGLVTLECFAPVELVWTLTPDFRPMWPAGMGGQIAHRDQATGALALTEELGRFALLCGSPEAEPVEVEADHSLPRGPLRIVIPVSVERAQRGPIPIFFAGAEVRPAPLSAAARVGDEGAALGRSRSSAVVARARDLYDRAQRDWSDWREKLERHWRSFLERTATFRSPDARHAEAFLWAKIAIERAWVEVDGLGRGLVAGLAPSGSSERPGFGWFFDGDALTASRAMCGYGDFEGARTVLEFAASHQRADGKLMHELVLSAGLCPWLDEFPYAYYKATTTPGFIACLEHFFRASGDRARVEPLLSHAERAFEHARSCVDPDGLLSNQRLGLAAVEAGPLVGRIRSELFLQGIWLSALSGLERLARELGRPQVADEAQLELGRASAAFESFWSAEHGRYGFARLVDGGICADLTAYHGHPLSRGHAAVERAFATAAQLNRPELLSDWGARLFASDSEGYAPAHYNTGSVFPYLTNFVVLALYRHGFLAAARQVLESQLALHGWCGLGCVPEHLVGDRALAPRRGVPHQIFSSACILQSTLFGMLGLELDAPHGRLTLRTALPEGQDFAELERLRLGPSLLDLRVERSRSGATTRLELRARLSSGPPIEIGFSPSVPAWSELVVGSRDSSPALTLERRGAALGLCGLRGRLEGELTLSTTLRMGPVAGAPPAELVHGEPSSAPRPTAIEDDGSTQSWTFWGRAGTCAEFGWTSDLPVRFENARATPDRLLVEFPASLGPWTSRVVGVVRA